MGLVAAWRRMFSAAAPSASPSPVVAVSPSHRLTVSSPQPAPHDFPAMARALDLARQAAQLGEVPIGALVYDTDSGAALGEGFNRREIDRDPAAHAEVFAIRAAARALGDWRLNRCTLVVTLEPCAMCAGLIVN